MRNRESNWLLPGDDHSLEGLGLRLSIWQHHHGPTLPRLARCQPGFQNYCVRQKALEDGAGAFSKRSFAATAQAASSNILKVRRKAELSRDQKSRNRHRRVSTRRANDETLRYPTEMTGEIGLNVNEINSLKKKGCPFYGKKTSVKWVRLFLEKLTGADALISSAAQTSER
ncbi:MAG: hypothetical protein QOE26_880 [Verrucomicrobiota bacterium]|jgi:hypothetical protein